MGVDIHEYKRQNGIHDRNPSVGQVATGRVPYPQTPRSRKLTAYNRRRQLENEYRRRYLGGSR